MINKNELRVGNWVYTPKALVLSEMSTSEMNDLIPYKIVFISDNGHNQFYEPILLTPEILEKAGFALKSEVNDYVIELLNRVQPKYLHQLQNLYFAIVGIELEINL